MKFNYKIDSQFKHTVCLLLLTTALTALFTTKANAQLNPLSSQYFLNQYQINPAYAGLTDGLNVNLNYRKQWSNIQVLQIRNPLQQIIN